MADPLPRLARLLERASRSPHGPRVTRAVTSRNAAFPVFGHVVPTGHGTRAARPPSGRKAAAALLLEPALGPCPTHVEPRRVVRGDPEETAPRRRGGRGRS